MIKRMIQTAVFAGFGAALILTLIQAFWVSPLILEAETYEQTTIATPHDSHHAEDHVHEEGGWAPADGWQRMTSTVAANLVVGVAFGLVMAGAISLRPPRKLAAGFLWGLGGYAVFILAPSMGLPPELPGTEAADLHARQLWWVGTAVATAIGLAFLVFSPGLWLKGVALSLLAVPHLIGAPQLASAQMLAPVDLHHKFVVATLIADGMFWLVLGLLSTLVFRRVSPGGPFASSRQEYV